MSLSTSPSAPLPPPCKLPGPSLQDEIAVLGVQRAPIVELTALVAEVYPAAKDMAEALAHLGFECRHIGIARVSEAKLIHDDGKRFWIFGPRLSLSRHGRSIVSSLRREGIWLPRSATRVVWGMPIGWHPQDTMEQVTHQVFRGTLPEDVRLLGVPFGTERSGWAYWVGVHVRNLEGQPRIGPVQFR